MQLRQVERPIVCDVNIFEVQVWRIEFKTASSLLDQNDLVLIDSLANFEAGQTKWNW
jgi:hypothetical protein